MDDANNSKVQAVHRAAKIDFWNTSKTLYLKVAGIKA